MSGAGTDSFPVAPDGSPVAFYRRLPAMGEPELIVGVVTHLGDAEVALLSAALEGDRLDAVVRYGVDGISWEQSFSARMLDEAAFAALLAEAGLRFDGWLERPGWYRAVRGTG